jgi:hypothetical protein
MPRVRAASGSGTNSIKRRCRTGGGGPAGYTEVRSGPTSYPVTVLPDMWQPLEGSERPTMVQAVRALNDPARINGFAVLGGGADAAVAAPPRTLGVAE